MGGRVSASVPNRRRAPTRRLLERQARISPTFFSPHESYGVTHVTSGRPVARRGGAGCLAGESRSLGPQPPTLDSDP